VSDEYEAGRCVIGSKPHGATVGLLCAHHLEQAGAMLRDIEDQAALLTAVPSMQQRNGRGGGLASQRTPARLEVLVHNDPRHGTGKSEEEDDEHAAGETLSILNTLHSWARIVREERDLTPPRQVNISSERDALTRWLTWVAAQDWVDEFYGDLAKLLGQLKGVNGVAPDRPYSYCPVITNGEQCIGQVWIRDELQPVWRRYPDRCAARWEQAPGAAVCDTCAATWTTPAEKAYLRRMIDDTATELTRPRTEDGEPMLTVVELVARGIVSSPANVRVIAHRNGAVSVGGYYDPRVFTTRASA
jgi:hypothetical protein